MRRWPFGADMGATLNAELMFAKLALDAHVIVEKEFTTEETTHRHRIVRRRYGRSLSIRLNCIHCAKRRQEAVAHENIPPGWSGAGTSAGRCRLTRHDHRQGSHNNQSKNPAHSF